MLESKDNALLFSRSGYSLTMYCHIPKHWDLHWHCCENLKICKEILVF